MRLLTWLQRRPRLIVVASLSRPIDIISTIELGAARASKRKREREKESERVSRVRLWRRVFISLFIAPPLALACKPNERH